MRVADVVGYVRRAERVSIVIGAGASRSAGIPMGPELVRRINAEFGHCLGALTEEERQDYGRAMGALSPGDRKALIQPLLDASRLNWGHIALACILKGGHLRRVLSFNFDLVLERAASLIGLQMPVYDFGVAPSPDISALASPAIFHLHGQSYGLKLMNSDEETRDHKDALRPLLADSVRNDVTLVIGYSGQSDPAFTVIQEAFNSNTNLIWLGHGAEAAHHLSALLAKRYATYVGGCDFDLTMIEIARGLGCWPPEVFTNPPLHVLRQLEDVVDFPVQPETGLDLLTSTRRRLDVAGERWEVDQDSTARSQEDLLAGKPQEAAGDVVGMSDEERKARAWSAIKAADALGDEAKGLSGAERAAKLQAAGEKYAEALRIKPDKHEALNNWGVALGDEAKGLSGAERAAKLQAAGEKYAEALRIKPDKHEALNNWGVALGDEAKGLSGAERAAKLQAAGEKYAEALRIKPDKHEALNNWGVALGDEAKGLSGAERAAKFQAAGEKYAEALRIKPDMHEALNNWGVALDDEAKGLSGAERAAKFQAAGEKYAEALRIKPDMHEALNNWAATLSFEASDRDGAEKAAKLREAEAKLTRHREITGKANYNMACVHALRGDVPAALDALDRCLADGTLPDADHLCTDTDMDPLRGEPRFQTLLAAHDGAQPSGSFR